MLKKIYFERLPRRGVPRASSPKRTILVEETAILAIGRPEFEAAYKQQLEFDKALDECARRELRWTC
jgi:hypothetical protein